MKTITDEQIQKAARNNNLVENYSFTKGAEWAREQLKSEYPKEMYVKDKADSEWRKKTVVAELEGFYYAKNPYSTGLIRWDLGKDIEDTEDYSLLDLISETEKKILKELKDLKKRIKTNNQ